MTRPMASAPSAATRPTSPAIAPASALARSICAMDEGDGGIADRTDLVAQAGRRPTRTARRRPSGGRRRIRGRRLGRAAASRDRGSRSDRPGECSRSVRARGSGSMIAAPPSGPAIRPTGALRCENMTAFERRRLLTAELLSIGSELTVGETRDTNAGELARSLTGMGVRVTRLTALPDDLDAGDRRVHDRPGPCRPRRLDRRAGPDARRPDPRGDRRSVR